MSYDLRSKSSCPSRYRWSRAAWWAALNQLRIRLLNAIRSMTMHDTAVNQRYRKTLEIVPKNIQHAG